MNKFKLLAIVGLTLLTTQFITGCATHSAKVGFDKNSKIDTSAYKTFVWLNEAKILAPAVDINPVMKVRVDDAIEAAFISKGYLLIEDPKKADFAISYSVGNRDKVKVHSYPATYSSRFMWGASYHRGRYNDVIVSNDTHVVQYTEGKLAIDVYDVKSHQPAWHGWATKRLSSQDKETPSATIKAIVSQVVAQF